LCEREEEKISANPQYRTTPRILKRLAEAHMFYELPRSEPGSWDRFSARNLGLLVNRRMAREFNGDSNRIRQASTSAVVRALKINSSRWSLDGRQALENWSLVLALIPDLERWSADEKRQLVGIIRAKAAHNEMRYLRLSQRHPRLRAELQRLGSG